jgi:hypothetical protein
MPYAGLRESGLGVGGIPHSFHHMQIQKMLVLDSKALIQGRECSSCMVLVQNQTTFNQE